MPKFTADFFNYFAVKLGPIFKSHKPFIYVALGDSTVEGVGATSNETTYPSVILRSLRTVYPKAQLYNLGKRGARASDILNYQLPQATALQPDLITISIGGNDVFHRTRSAHFEKDIEKLLTSLKQDTKAIIIINSIPNMTATRVPLPLRLYWNRLAQRFNVIIESHAKAASAMYVDLFAATTRIKAEFAELICQDGIHPSDKGYSLWADHVWTYVEKSL